MSNSPTLNAPDHAPDDCLASLGCMGCDEPWYDVDGTATPFSLIRGRLVAMRLACGLAPQAHELDGLGVAAALVWPLEVLQ